MISEQEIRDGYQRKFNRQISEDDYIAMVRFILWAECGDSETFEEAFERLMISIRMLSDSPFEDAQHRLDRF
jgi:hypothetical protein